MARLFDAFASQSTIEDFAIKAALILPTLLLQKPFRKSKYRDHSRCLMRRWEMWKDGAIQDLVSEGATIQKHLKSSKSRPLQSSTAFSQSMLQGNVKKALRFLSDESQQGVLDLDDIGADGKLVKDILLEKHPAARPLNSDCLVPPRDNDFHPVLFEAITAEAIKSAATHTFGAAGPSGVDAWVWRRLCCAFGNSSHNLCGALAAFCKRISCDYVDPQSLSAYTACRLLPLNKNPGVRPIGIAEVCRRILGKAIMLVCKSDLVAAVCPSQLCVGLEAGCEAAFHSLKCCYEDTRTQGLLLVDASNAFNNLNRTTTLCNAHSICPILAPILTNTYRTQSNLFVNGTSILSQEGTTQGDPLAMAMYAIGTLPLIDKLENPVSDQIWYADDSASSGSISDIKRWWDLLNQWGPKFGYFPNSSKTRLLVKDQFKVEAENMFKDSGIQISVEGCTYLGGVIGSESFIHQVVESKVATWTKEIVRLSEFASAHPHEAYAALTHGIISKWNYFIRVTDFSCDFLKHSLGPLEDALSKNLISALTGKYPLGQVERNLLALPIRMGGLGIIRPSEAAMTQYSQSITICSPLVKLILDYSGSDIGILQCISEQRTIKAIKKKEWQDILQATATSVRGSVDPSLQLSMDLAAEKGASIWLSTLPIKTHGFALSKSDFFDALRLRYNWSFPDTPSICRCGKEFSPEHLLSCPTGGFPSIRHNEIRDITASLLTETCHGVTIEPRLQPLTGEHLSFSSSNSSREARLDIAANGVWGSRFVRSFFDVRVFNPFAPTNRISSLSATYRKHEEDKIRSYQQRILDVEHATFVPLIFSTTGGMGIQCSSFYRQLALLLSEKQDIPYSVSMCMIRCRLNFALLRSSILCLRGTRSSMSKPLFDTPIALQHAETQPSLSVP